MARIKAQIEKRNALIMAEYNDLFFKDMLRQEVCIKRLSEKYFLSESTIYRMMLTASKEDKQEDCIEHTK